MGLSRKVVRIELTSRVADETDRTAIPGMALWEVSWTARDQLGRERTWSAPHITEAGARRAVANLLAERAPELAEAVFFSDRTTEDGTDRRAGASN